MRGEHADVVVVGSGFGGAVTAYRLASAGLSVVVLERGRAYPPGSFPRTPSDMGRAFWDPAEGLHGLYDVWSFTGCDSVVASGLGGGSLIYANVLLRKDERWFVHDEPVGDGGVETWPVTRADLDPHYDAVERMLGATPYPFAHPAYAHTPKTIALRDAATELGLDWRLPPLAVSFAGSPGAEPGLGLPIVAPAYGNVHGVPRRTCRLCGECNMGCNDGAKNTLDHTYLSAAAHHGADLRTLHEARAVRQRAAGGYAVDYVRHRADGGDGTDVGTDGGADGGGETAGTIECDRLVLAAGTLGTTRLLLRSRDGLPALSGALGSRFSGNGDVLAFLLRAKDRSRTHEIDASHGPVITSAIRLPDGLDDPAEKGRGAYIEDGGHPAFVDWLVEGADVRTNFLRASRFAINLLWATLTRDQNLSSEISGLFGDAGLSTNSLPLLGMGRDVPDGRLCLSGGDLDVRWSGSASAEHFERLETTMRRIADVLGGDYAGLPAWLGKRFITVHPLGGAPMGHHAGDGVCDGHGEVFGHPGLYVADGAAMPGPVGANPSLTIAALADRMSTRLLENRPARRGPRPGAATTPAVSLSFDEEMAGSVVVGATDPATAGDGEPLSFRLTIHVDDLDAFLANPEHLAGARGWVDGACCGGRQAVERGWFSLFAPGGEPGSRVMRYQLWFTDGDGNPRTLSGWKDVRDGPVTRMWHDTSTLYTRVLRGHVPPGGDGETVAAGTLHIAPGDLVATLGSFRAGGACPVGALARFGRFFVGELWDVYGPGWGAPPGGGRAGAGGGRSGGPAIDRPAPPDPRPRHDLRIPRNAVTVLLDPWCDVAYREDVVRFWVLFRLLTAVATIAVMMMWGLRSGEVLREAGHGWRAVVGELTIGFLAPVVFFLALLAIPFEVYVLRKRRTWHLYASVVVLGFNGVLAVTSVMTPPEATFDPELTAAYDPADRIIAGAFQFLSFYYLMWAPIIFMVAFIALFVRGRRETYDSAGSATAEVALDAGPTLAYLGLLLGVVSVAQAYEPDKGWQQLIVPVGLGAGFLVLVVLTLAGYRRARA